MERIFGIFQCDASQPACLCFSIAHSQQPKKKAKSSKYFVEHNTRRCVVRTVQQHSTAHRVKVSVFVYMRA